ncbi:MAG: diaminopimelate epimerase [Bacillota bacterium]|nr:MAG: diaminopimelate epimerase [Bacillota bacterium]
MHFTKMHGLGNDYLYVFGEVPENITELSIKLSERHFGAGSDGMIYISPSKTADFKMRIFNADGSEAKMCGNGIRCVGKYVYDKGYTDKTHLKIETLSGIKTLELFVTRGKVRQVSVDMGKTVCFDEITVAANGKPTDIVPVSVGNPHAVVFVADAEKQPIAVIGPQIEHDKHFPDGVNVEFVQVIDGNTLRMRVWERGSGITMACGTGACASVSAAVQKGYVNQGEFVTVKLDGGDLKIKVNKDGEAIMTGPAEFVYEGDTVC